MPGIDLKTHGVLWLAGNGSFGWEEEKLDVKGAGQAGMQKMQRMNLFSLL